MVNKLYDSILDIRLKCVEWRLRRKKNALDNFQLEYWPQALNARSMARTIEMDYYDRIRLLEERKKKLESKKRRMSGGNPLASVLVPLAILSSLSLGCLPKDISDYPKRCYSYQENGISRYEDENIIAYHECFKGRNLSYTDRNKDGKIDEVGINLDTNTRWNSRDWENLQKFAQRRVDNFNSK